MSRTQQDFLISLISVLEGFIEASSMHQSFCSRLQDFLLCHPRENSLIGICRLCNDRPNTRMTDRRHTLRHIPRPELHLVMMLDQQGKRGNESYNSWKSAKALRNHLHFLCPSLETDHELLGKTKIETRLWSWRRIRLWVSFFCDSLLYLSLHHFR